MDGRKSVFFAYLFALIGGPFGLHHLYLGRTQHALVWFTTFGGFLFGWIYELLFSIPKYVREANCDHQLMLHSYIRMRQMKSPAFEMTRLCGKSNSPLDIDYFSIIQTKAPRFGWFEKRFFFAIVKSEMSVSETLKYLLPLFQCGRGQKHRLITLFIPS